MIDTRRLRYFVALADARHFGRAAEALNIAQPALTQQIRLLERDLDATLFSRTSRPITLTAAGAVLLREARVVLDQLDRAAWATRRAAKGAGASISIGATGSAACGVVPRFLSKLVTTMPDVTLGDGAVAEASGDGGLQGAMDGLLGHRHPGVRLDRRQRLRWRVDDLQSRSAQAAGKRQLGGVASLPRHRARRLPFLCRSFRTVSARPREKVWLS